MTNSDEIMMTRYLFGELSEAEQAQMEERYFADRPSFNRLVQLETQLLDDYARGRLSAEMRERLERTYLHNPNRRGRLKFSNALTARFDEAAASAAAGKSGSRSTSLWFRIWSLLTGGPKALRFTMAVALLGFASLSVWLFIESQRLRRELARTRDTQSVQAQQQREAERQLASERGRGQQLTDEVERLRAEAKLLPEPTGRIASLLLIAREARGTETGAPPTLIISRQTTQVRLELRRSENEYKSYELGLQTAGGKEVLHRRHFRPMSVKSG